MRIEIPQELPRRREIESDINERLLSYVQVRFPGYIRKVFANATYQYVRKGEPLFTIYSPDRCLARSSSSYSPDHWKV